MKKESLHSINNISKRLEFLHKRLSDFVKVEPAFIEISEPIFMRNNFSINIKIRKHSDQTPRGYKLSIYNFALQGKLTGPEGLLYNGKFYNYNELNKLFELLLSEMKDF